MFCGFGGFRGCSNVVVWVRVESYWSREIGVRVRFWRVVASGVLGREENSIVFLRCFWFSRRRVD